MQYIILMYEILNDRYGVVLHGTSIPDFECSAFCPVFFSFHVLYIDTLGVS